MRFFFFALFLFFLNVHAHAQQPTECIFDLPQGHQTTWQTTFSNVEEVVRALNTCYGFAPAYSKLPNTCEMPLVNGGPSFTMVSYDDFHTVVKVWLFWGPTWFYKDGQMIQGRWAGLSVGHLKDESLRRK